jgi:23S rRNA (cytosine1962-C5)-methyltransferase
MGETMLRLKPRKDRPVRLGHPWIFSGAVADLDPALPPGTPVAVCSAEGEFLGRGYANPRCAIAVRLLTWRDEPTDAALLQRRVAAALALRRTVVPPGTDAFRVLNGEGDFLPGFVADAYGEVVVLQCLTAGAAALKTDVVAALQATLAPAGIYERSSGGVRREEGLDAAVGVLAGAVPETPVHVREGGLHFLVDVRGGQKTGFFLDQRDNRALARQLAGGRTVLNAFAYTGAFAVYAGAGDARRVVSVESAARALELARRHWVANTLDATRAAFIEADVHRYLRQTAEVFDLLVLDPPALVRRRAELARGARAYKDLHLWAFRRAAPGAYVLTFSCSPHVSADLFWKIVHGAARDAGRAAQVLRLLGAGADHPVSLAHPEGGYLKGLLLRLD